jgi:hypothetical protein
MGYSPSEALWASGNYSTPVHETHFIVSLAECGQFSVALGTKAQTPKAPKTCPVARRVDDLLPVGARLTLFTVWLI